MTNYQKPAHWANPKNKLFPHQVGFTCPPHDFDGDNLLEDPHTMVERWCEAVQIPFLAEALSWEPGARDEVSWWDGGSFHANLRNSNGLKAQNRKYIDIDQAPDRVKQIYDKVLPHYRHMHAHRLMAIS